MKVYLIYAFMPESEYFRANLYGQYDIFKEGKCIDDMNIVLWGFTTSKKIYKKFFQQRTVKNRYFTKEVSMNDTDFDNFSASNRRYELLPYAYDMDNTIGDEDGYFIEYNPAIIYSDSLPEKEHYCMRISTRYEYDYIANNCGEILSCRISNLFEAYPMCLSTKIFKNPMREFLDRSGYLLEALTYHPLSIEYMNANEKVRTAYTYLMNYQPVRKNECSMLKLLYITFPEMFYERTK